MDDPRSDVTGDSEATYPSEAAHLEYVAAARGRVRAFVCRLPNTKSSEIVDNRHGDQWPLLRGDLDILIGSSYPPEDLDPSTLRIAHGHLVEATDECNCAGTDIGIGTQHEPGCGLEPLMTVTELAALISAANRLGQLVDGG